MAWLSEILARVPPEPAYLRAAALTKALIGRDDSAGLTTLTANELSTMLGGCSIGPDEAVTMPAEHLVDLIDTIKALADTLRATALAAGETQGFAPGSGQRRAVARDAVDAMVTMALANR